jgi:hypothetical protein
MGCLLYDMKRRVCARRSTVQGCGVTDIMRSRSCEAASRTREWCPEGKVAFIGLDHEPYNIMLTTYEQRETEIATNDWVSSLMRQTTDTESLDFFKTHERASLGVGHAALLILSRRTPMCMCRAVLRERTGRANIPSAATGDTRARAALGGDDVQFRIAP